MTKLPPQEIRGQNQAVNEYPEYEFMLYCPKKVNKHSGIDRNCRLRMFFFHFKTNFANIWTRNCFGHHTKRNLNYGNLFQLYYVQSTIIN